MEEHKAEGDAGAGGLRFYAVGRESLTEKVTFQLRIDVSEGVNHVDICGEKWVRQREQQGQRP